MKYVCERVCLCSSLPLQWTLGSGINSRSKNSTALKYSQITELWTLWNSRDVTRDTYKGYASQFLTYIMLETWALQGLRGNWKVNGIGICVDMTDSAPAGIKGRGKEADVDKDL